MKPPTHPTIAAALIGLLATAAATGPARADYVATAAEEKAMAARIAKSPPGPAELGGAPYPGAVLDVRCSADRSASHRGNPMMYCYRSRDSAAQVKAYFDGPGRLYGDRPSVSDESPGTMILHSVDPKKRAFLDAFPAEPPSAAELIAPVPAGARYDRSCSALRSWSDRQRSDVRRVYCYLSEADAGSVRRELGDYLGTRQHGVHALAVDASTPTAVRTRIEYTLLTAGPQPPAPAPAPTAAATPAPTAPAPAAEPAPSPATDTVKQATDAVNKLRGLFGR
ncbi:hypothetical protein [Methylibium sp. Pch-M]|uniref:hypothetical protein n=1 Tax=Methylibium sp. Pch-M TaxID=2082386 RepID=UPI001A932C2F|nr:hypothetical protein [Methylibium sp. Pch-M]